MLFIVGLPVLKSIIVLVHMSSTAAHVQSLSFHAPRLMIMFHAGDRDITNLHIVAMAFQLLLVLILLPLLPIFRTPILLSGIMCVITC
jgi:hypothetical protein